MPRLFGAKLKYLRQQRGMTQTELSERLGIAQGHVANLEAGRDVPSLALLVRIAMSFTVVTDYLLRDNVPIEESATSKAEPITEVTTLPHWFGAKLRSLRLQHNLTQVALTRHLGLARQGYISNLEAGRKVPSLDLVIQLSDLFEVTTDYLLRAPLPIEETNVIPED